jgi:hypothetical protein
MSNASRLGSLTTITMPTIGVSFAECRAILASEDCTADITQADGGDVDGVPLNRGVNPIAAIKIRAVSAGTVKIGY